MIKRKKKPGPKRQFVRDALSKTKRGQQAIEKVRKVRIKALRKKAGPDYQAIEAIEKHKEGRPLTDKQRMFVRYWAQGETPRTAAIQAGYSENSSQISWKMARDPAMLKLYREEKDLYAEAAQLSREHVMRMLKESYDHAKMINEPATMVAAARELGKMCGYYEPEKKLIGIVGGKLAEKMFSMSDEELLKIIEEKGDVFEGEGERLPETHQLMHMTQQ